MRTRNLSDAENVSHFRPRQRNLLIGVSLLVAHGLAMVWLSPKPSPASNAIFFSTLFASFLYAFWATAFYLCPNCGARPKATRYAVGSETSVSQGLNLFPKHCERCGLALSRKAMGAGSTDRSQPDK
jgi:hypothetical protein